MSHPIYIAIRESQAAVLRNRGVAIDERLLDEMARNAAQEVLGAIESGDVTIEVDLGDVSDAVRDEEHQAWERQWAAPC
jgi:hypothetical protein